MRTMLIVCTLILVGAGTAWAQTTTVTGTVVDYLARPVVGAEVTAQQIEARYGDRCARGVAPVVRTDADGRFELEADSTSQYDTFIVARKDGLALAWDRLNYSTYNIQAKRVLLVLESPCLLTGEVVDANGAPIAGAQVQAVPTTSYLSTLNQRPIYGPAEWFSTVTDADGVFRFEAFSADVSADFCVQAPGRSCTYTFTTYPASSCGFEPGRADISLILPTEGLLRGHAIDQKTGKGVDGVTLMIQPERDRQDIHSRYLTRTVETGSDGTFECAGLPEGQNKISVAENLVQTPDWIAEPVVVNVIAGQVHDDVRLSLSEGGLIAVQMRQRGTDQPIAGIRITTGRTSALTDDLGRATLRVPPGEHSVYCGGGRYQWWNTEEPVVVEEGRSTPLEVLLDPMPQLHGTVTDDEGLPAPGVLVVALPSGDHVYTDRNGKFAIGYILDLAGEGVWVVARDRARSLATVAHVTPINEPIELSLSPAATVVGQIADADDRGVPATRVTLNAIVSLDRGNYECSIGEEVLTDSQGRFELQAIPPVREPIEYSMSACATDYAPGSLSRMTFAGQANQTVDVGTLALSAANMSVSGVVVDANGVPAPEVILILTGTGGVAQPQRTTATDQQGRFAINRIAAGPIKLQVSFSSLPGGMGTVRAHAGDRNIRAVVGERVVHERYASLVGQPLPDVADLGVDIPRANMQGKAILLCFFDCQQRPSRRALVQLAEQADVLPGSGVTAIVVQASEADGSALSEWAEQNDISFPINVIPGDIGAAREAWGVQSLPWLILTDVEHTVAAEGFSVEELDAHLTEMKR